MSLSRTRVFSLLVAVLALAGVLSACGGGSSDENPEQVVETASLEGLESGALEMTLDITSEGEAGGQMTLAMSGQFQARGTEALPEMAMTGSLKGNADGEAVDAEGGLTLLSDRAFVNYEGTEYEVDPTTFGFVKAGIEQSQAGAGEEAGAADLSACQKAVEGIELASVIDNLSNEGEVDVEGASTTKVSGELNPEGAIDALIAVTDEPACSSQLEMAGPLPLAELEAARGEVSKALKDARVELYVGDDDIIRKAVVEMRIEPPGGEEGSVEMSMEMILSGVNEKQDIQAPRNAEPLEGLFRELGVNPLELFEAGSSGGLEGLLDQIGGGSAGGSGEEGGSGGGEEGGSGGIEIDPEELPDAEASLEYLECLQGAESAKDLQECASLLS